MAATRTGEFEESSTYHFQNDLDRMKKAFGRLLGADWSKAFRLGKDYAPKPKSDGYWHYREKSVFEVCSATILGRPKVSPAVTQLHPYAETIFKDSYLVDFLGLPEAHSEHQLQTAIIVNLKRFLLELGRDFAFVGEQYLLPVGGQDFRLDLLFYHRQLQSLIAIELKVDEFKPEYLGKLEFYLEALDRDVRKSHENPSIGVLLCASKENEVVEYALSRAASPALIAEYQTRLPDRRTLQRKLHEFYELVKPGARAAAKEATHRRRRVSARGYKGLASRHARS